MTENAETAKIQAAFEQFMAAKYPGQTVPDVMFMFFDPKDKIRDWNRGVLFMEPSPEYLMKDPSKRGLFEALRLSLSGRKRPRRAGWYFSTGQGTRKGSKWSSWMFLAATADAAADLFVHMARELRTKKRAYA